MSTNPPVVLYHYEASPFAKKVQSLLALKGVPYTRVLVLNIPPRPALSTLLGITYRRVPVLAIGSDIYCDSAAIASALERRFPAAPTLYPFRVGVGKTAPIAEEVVKTDTAVVRALAFWAEGQVFPTVQDHMPYESLPAEWIHDRSGHRGAPIDIPTIVARRDDSKSTVASHLALLEAQLADGREWLLDTTAPGLADIIVHTPFAWARTLSSLADLFDPTVVPRTIAWLDRTSTYLDARRVSAPVISPEDAAHVITSAQAEDIDYTVGFNATDARRLGTERGDAVTVTPRDVGKVPTVGTLVALSSEEIVLETRGEVGVVRCHFPRLGFQIKKAEAKL
ncbi:uncharacterized protein FIBRA_00445 [Fibroporia radiculosa]|uniref:GST N-terminal domain-containing protein n=1 Tax=Fibroporia radiculosa TaxID=599839 RepID=J4HRM1_9APHY|nr:uncharacterized protein FIBRA_00445 [Fibroporia radiculosa]CCL98447.1 predicted protein [Fibroporia radiculosa]